MDLELGQIVRTKKKHPCGNDLWEIVRVGADIKARCLGCGHVVMMGRPKFEKLLRKIKSPKDLEKIEKYRQKK